MDLGLTPPPQCGKNPQFLFFFFEGFPKTLVVKIHTFYFFLLKASLKHRRAVAELDNFLSKKISKEKIENSEFMLV